MKNFLIAITLTLTGLTQAQQTIPLDDPRFDFFEREPRKLETFKGREALYLNGKAFLRDVLVRDGILQVDFTAAKPRSFAGFIVRAQDDGSYEAPYVRLHKSTMPDALQYNPEYNYESNWQLYAEHQNFANFDQYAWNTLRIEVRGSEMKVFLNDLEKPALEVDNLRRGTAAGYIGFYSFIGAYFSNFSYELLDTNTAAKPTEPAAPGIITSWEISENRLVSETALDSYPNAQEIKWTEVTAEPSGLLPINKYVKKSKAGSFERNEDEVVWVKHTFSGSNGATRKFYFDFSDNVEVFFNGKLIFSGKNSFRYKGLTHRGDIRLEGQMLYLETKSGENEILCAVSDRANGWAILGKLE